MMPMTEVITRMVEKNLTSVTELSELAGVSPSTVYRWMNGNSQPSFDSIRLLVRHLANPEAQKSLLHALIHGTSWHIQWVPGATFQFRDENAGDYIHTAQSLRESSALLTAASHRLAISDGIRSQVTTLMPMLSRLAEDIATAHPQQESPHQGEMESGMAPQPPSPVVNSSLAKNLLRTPVRSTNALTI